MTAVYFTRLRALLGLMPLALFASSAFAGVNVVSPKPSSTVPGNVNIAASANENGAFHLEIWDNGGKLGDYMSNSVNTTRAMPQGGHTMTVLAVANTGGVLNQSTVKYNVGSASNPGSGSGSVNISSPTNGATSISAVRINASANQSNAHLQLYDNGYKLGVVNSENVNGVYVLPNGSHVLTVQAINNSNGTVISSNTVNYKVEENCSTSGNKQCDMDQMPIDNSQNVCNPPLENKWIANPCGGGVQGANPTNPQRTEIQGASEGSNPSNDNNVTLNGRSIHVLEEQGYNPSNVLFRTQSPNSTGNAVDSHWTMDTYVHLPDPTAHQALEFDVQYTGGGIWSKMYTECAFNQQNGTGYWGIFDSSTGGWIFLNGRSQGGQTPPVVRCDRNQFSQPWAGSGNPGFSGWHHIVWNFHREGDGTVTFLNVTVDGTTNQVNFHPNSRSGGNVNDRGNYSALIQLDGIVNHDRQHNTVDAFVSEFTLTHTP